MNAHPADCVVDASVAIKLFVEEELSDRAHALFQRLDSNPDIQIYVPDLFYAECANILWKYTWRFGLPKAEARQSLDRLHALALTRIIISAIVKEALDTALGHSISVYDGCYVAAAKRLKVPLITADRRLARKLAGARTAVGWLGDLSTDSEMSS